MPHCVVQHEEGFTELVEAALERHPDNVTRVANFVTKVLLGVLNERQVTLPKRCLVPTFGRIYLLAFQQNLRQQPEF